MIASVEMKAETVSQERSFHRVRKVNLRLGVREQSSLDSRGVWASTEQ